jgi:nitrite reductase (NO-forming)
MTALVSQSFKQVNNTSLSNGKTVYETYCMSCHQEKGEGVPGAFPPLVKTGHLADKNKLVKTILQGMRGPINVNGVKYENEMASISLTDKETADVINYIRNSWGNKAPMVSVAEVSAAKKH